MPRSPSVKLTCIDESYLSWWRHRKGKPFPPGKVSGYRIKCIIRVRAPLLCTSCRHFFERHRSSTAQCCVHRGYSWKNSRSIDRSGFKKLLASHFLRITSLELLGVGKNCLVFGLMCIFGMCGGDCLTTISVSACHRFCHRSRKILRAPP